MIKFVAGCSWQKAAISCGQAGHRGEAVRRALSRGRARPGERHLGCSDAHDVLGQPGGAAPRAARHLRAAARGVVAVSYPKTVVGAVGGAGSLVSALLSPWPRLVLAGLMLVVLIVLAVVPHRGATPM